MSEAGGFQSFTVKIRRRMSWLTCQVRLLGGGRITLAMFFLFLITGCETPPPLVPVETPPLPHDIGEHPTFQSGLIAYERGSYDEAIAIFKELIARDAKGPFAYEAQWLLAKSYEAKGDVLAAVEEYKRVRAQFPQTAYGSQALQRLLAIDQPPHPSILKGPLRPPISEEYRIGEEDELEISVYGDEDLTKTQTVRPGGTISFPFIRSVQAVGRTAQELQEEITKGLSRYVRNPQVSVIIKKYNSKQVFVLGEVKSPGVLRLSSEITLLEAISRAEGLRETADLQGALLIRDGQIVPVDFEQLFKRGNFAHNVALKPNDTILIPTTAHRIAQVLGEVKNPGVIKLTPGVTLSESIAEAGGFTKDAVTENIVILRGGLAHPRMIKVNFDEITQRGDTAHNVTLEPLDVVYVPRMPLATVERYNDIVAKISQFALLGVFAAIFATTPR
jgi:polysaccharide export outer membrane protein